MNVNTIETIANSSHLSAQLIQTESGLRKLSVISALASAEIYLQGAHLTSFIPKDDTEIFWLSPIATFEQGKAIRGGIPICWPWFGRHIQNPALPQHGFARLSDFQLSDLHQLENGVVSVTMKLAHSPQTLASWPYQFLLSVNFLIGQSLTVTITTENQSPERMPLTQAIHSYFGISDIHNTRLLGLEHCPFLDQLTGLRDIQKDEELIVENETDRIYQTQNAQIELVANGRHFFIRQANENSTVVWNPWKNKASAMSDFPDNGFNEMLCVEAANSLEPTYLQPGATSSLSQVIQVC